MKIRDRQHLCDLLKIPFSDDQLAAITAPANRPQAIIAGAGSGKTTVMAARVVWLVGHDGVDPARILGLTFTNKAAGELGEKVRDALRLLGADVATDPGTDVGEPTVSTYHAFAGQLITEFGLLIGLEPDLRLLADASRFQLAARAVATYRGDLPEISVHTPTLVLAILGMEGQLSEHLVSTSVLREHAQQVLAEAQAVPIRRKSKDDPGWSEANAKSVMSAARRRIELTHLVDRYRELKSEHGLMDFSDQMLWGAQLAEVAEVSEALRERYDVVLLDEYQDTSVAQHLLLQRLFGGHGVTAVGDPAQSIYGWRGAAAGNLLNFLDDFPSADGSRGLSHSLHVTRRCAPEVIDIANKMARNFYEQPDVDITPLQAAPENAAGVVSAALHSTVQHEIDDLVHRITTLHDDGMPWREIAVLVRVGKENGAIVEALRSVDVPVEVVGMTGLLHQPEVRDVLSVLELLHDVTANPAVIRLLVGPRWRLGVRDLALLGKRAGQLGGRRAVGADDESPEDALERELSAAVEGVDPADIVSLAEAVDDPGDLPYSAEARRRLGELAALLRHLRAHLGEPLVDLTRRVVSALDLDVELALRPDGIGPDNISALLDAVAGYSENDRYADLAGLMAYLEAEDEYAGGLEVASPSESDSVKLLTAHKSKGLEYDAVFVPLLSKTVFPSSLSRPRWPTRIDALPVALRGDHDSLPDLAEWTNQAMDEFKAEWDAEALLEEDRLAYVAFTRARHHLHVSGHHWGRTQKKPLGPSAYLEAVRKWLGDRGDAVTIWADAPADDEVSPFLGEGAVHHWPVQLGGLAARHEAAAMVAAARSGQLAEPEDASGITIDVEARERLDSIDAELDLLLAEAAELESPVREVMIPPVLSATATMALAADEQAFLRQLARPVPRRPSAAARFGTQFHARIEAHYGQQALLDPTDLPGQGDVAIGSDPELDELFDRFVSGEFGSRTPVAIEAPFSIRLAGRQIIGRIDAVFETTLPDGSVGYEVVDWKTNADTTADRLQLAIYRLAWAEQHGLDPTVVTGAFAYVRLDQTVRYDDLPGRAELEELIAG